MAAANSSYEYPDAVLATIRAAQARRPRIKQSVISSHAIEEVISREIKNGEWTLIGGELIHSSGANVEGHLDDLCAARVGDDGGVSFWVEEEEVSKVHDEVWCTGGPRGLTLQGERYKVIRANFAPGKEWDKHAAHLLDEEAKLYSTKVGSIQAGRPPGEPEKPEAAAPKLPGQGSSTNPWSPKFFGSQNEKFAAMEKIMKGPGGSRLASSLAKSENVDLAGRPLRGS